jgi:hypothetical protein
VEWNIDEKQLRKKSKNKSPQVVKMFKDPTQFRYGLGQEKCCQYQVAWPTTASIRPQVNRQKKTLENDDQMNDILQVVQHGYASI